jgi:DNA-binding transcriptional regulator LsrR (DeoR family)
MNIKNLPLDERAQRAAYLRARFNMSQEEIGSVLGGLSQPQVSRLLAHAEKKHYLAVERRFVEDGIQPETLRQIKEMLRPDRLTGVLHDLGQALGVRVPNVRVFGSGPGTTPDAMRIRRNRFGRTAAGRLDELLQDAKVVGVAWGRTISAMVDGLVPLRPASRDDHIVQFVPVCAELIALAQKGYSSSRLAERLDDIYNHGRGEPIQLTGFPAYIPKHYDEVAQRSIRQFVEDSPNYGQVFSGPDPLIDRMDALITSVGSARSPVFGSTAELALAGGVEEAQLRTLILGDLGGILISKPNATEDQKDLVEKLNAMWTGVRIEHVRTIAQRAADDPAQAGVIVAALRAERGETIIELIRRELVNELILDDAAAEGLERRIAEELT